jgi:DNA invertase Pin-like site-specific DNA recombinase
MATGKQYGYARVSTKDQKEDRQLVALMECGVAGADIFTDKQSGKNFDRPKYKRLMKKLRPGDTLFIKSIDRLGRNYEEIIEQWRVVTKDKGVDIVVLDMPLLDTRKQQQNLTGTFIADLVLQILSYVAETERTNTRQRQAEGIAIAKAKGVKFGHPPRERPERFPELFKAWRLEEISARAAARELGIAQRTFILWAAERSAIVTE